MKPLYRIIYFILTWDYTLQTNLQTLNIGIIHYSTGKAGLTKDIMEPLLQSYVSENYPESFRITWGTVNTSSRLDTMNTAYGLLNSGIHVLISALRCPQLTSVSAMTETLRIPHLALDIDTCSSSRNEPYTLHLVNRFHYLPNMVADIVVKEVWNKLILVTDSKNDRGHVSRFVKELSKVGVETVLGDISLLEMLYERKEPDNFLVITDNPLPINRMMKRTKSYLLHKWIFVTDLNITQTYPTGSSIVIRSRYKTFLTEYTSRRESLTYTERQLFDVVQAIVSHPGRVLLDRNNPLTESCGKEGPAFRGWADNLQQLITQICKTEQRPNGLVTCNCVEYEIYGLSVDGLFRTQPLGVWNPNHGLILNQYRESLFRDNFTNFGGVNLRVAVDPDSFPFSSRTTASRGYEGLVIDILDDMSKMLNFKYELLEPEDNLYGHQLENGSWTGLVGMALKQEVDLAVGILSVTLERSAVVDFVTPFMQDGLGILAPRPVRKADMFQAYKAFSMDVWFLVLMCGVFVSLGLILIQYLLGPDSGYPGLKDNWAQESIFLVVSSFFEQGLSWQPVRGSARCLLGFWMVFTILTFAMYTANLAAVLTVSSPVQPINNLEDLAARPDLEVAVEYGTALWDLLQETTIPLYQGIGRRVVSSNLVEVIDRIISGKLVWLGDKSYLRFHDAQSCGAARVGEETFQSISQGFVVPKNSPYKNGFDISVQKMVESGITLRLEKKWLLQKVNCTSQTTEEPIQSLDFSRLGGVFIVFGAFVFTAIVSLVLDQFVYKRFIEDCKKGIQK